MKYRDFIKDLKNGNKWEKKLAPILERFIFTYKAKIMNFSTIEGREKQRKGVDIELVSEEPDIEVKTRHNKYYKNKDILLETVSVIHQNILGWVYTSEADVIAYCWETENKTNLEPIGYLILLQKLRKTDWFKTIENRGVPTKVGSCKNGLYWESYGRAIPINDFPPGVLYEFDPTLESTIYKQVKLDRPDKISSYL